MPTWNHRDKHAFIQNSSSDVLDLKCEVSCHH